MAKEVVAGLFQIVVAILGAVTPVVVERMKRSTEEAAASGAAPGGPLPIHERNLLDLSILLIYGAFLSAILSHSIFISGREPSFSPTVLGGVTLITGATSFVLYFAWLKGFGEMTAGAMSLAALIVLLIAPGNITRLKEDAGRELGLPLLLPVWTLTFATSVAMMYLFGNPLGRENEPRRRRNVGIALLLLAFTTSAILGFDFVADAVRDDLAPKFDGTDEAKREGESLLVRVRALDPARRGLFYRLASDSVSSPEYRFAYFSVRSDVQEWDAALARARERFKQSVAASASPAPIPVSETAELETAEPETAEPETPEETVDVPTISDSARAGSIRESAEQDLMKSGLLGRSSSNDEDSRRSRSRRMSRLQFLSTLSQGVESLDDNALIAQIDERLRFVHPTPLPPRFDQLLLSMPGTTATNRYTVINHYRVKRFERDLPWDDETFNYSDGLDSTIIAADEARRTADPKAPAIEEVIFPRTLGRADPQFALQLALPRAEESYVHYRAATMLAAKQLKSGDSDLLIKDFNDLSAAERWAITEFIAPRKDETSLALLTQLAESGTTPAMLPATTDARFDVAARLQRNQSDPCGDASETVDVCRWLSSALRGADRTQMAKLISQPDRNGASVTALFTPQALGFVKKAAQRRALLDVIADPVTAAMRVVGAQEKLDPKLFDDFEQLTPENQQGLLWHVAVMLYRAQGDNSLGMLPLLAFHAHSLSPSIAFASATLLMLPFTIGAIALGGFAARKLVERDRMRALVVAENASGQLVGDIGLPVDLLGREPLLEKIRKLGGRGWSTIAVVGRRGIGKSRLLFELFKPARTVDAAAVSVWIPAPTNYDEAEFVESVFERLALRAERAVADQLQAKPLPVRLLERRQAQVGVWMFGTALLSLAALLAIANARTFRPEVMATWVPILILAALAVATLVRFLAYSVQPIDLSAWLERDRSRNASSVLLYRESRAALSYLKSRRAQAEGVSRSFSTSAIISSLVVFVTAMFLLTISDWTWPFSFAVSAALAGIVGAQSLRIAARPAVDHAGTSLMSLTANYRKFAARVVHHVDAQALGQPQGVMICIDELDKVIDEVAVRDFLRRMKGIFEVPGVYYYVSLAEDTLARLYLAPGEGKNEIDSSLDHIVRVQPLSFADGESLVCAYAKKLGFSNVDRRLSMLISAVSFGVPRDIIRRCDEVVSTWVGKPEGILTVPNTAAVARAVRLERVDVACEREGWLRQVRDRLAASAADAAAAAAEILGTLENERSQRVMSLLWILSMCELAAEANRPPASAFWSRIYRFGYDLPTTPLSDIAATIIEISTMVDTAPAPASTIGPRSGRRLQLRRAQELFDRHVPDGNGYRRTPL